MERKTYLKNFKEEWQNNLKRETDIIADGWYNPPPIKNCYNAVQEVFSELGKLENSAELFSCSEQIFAK